MTNPVEIKPLSRKRFANYSDTPPGGWRYAVPEVGSKLVGPFTNWPQLLENLKVRYNAAGYPIPSNIYDKVQDYICEQQPEYCGEPGTVGMYSGPSEKATFHTFHAAMQCLQTLISHRAGSGERPDMELQEARAKVCVECPENQDTQGCSMCNVKALSGMIKKLVGAKVTSVDKRLKFCAVCHCSTAAKVATKHEAIWKHMPERQKANLPSTCWLIVEHEAQEAKYEQTPLG
jgi:hypothetical protein